MLADESPFTVLDEQALEQAQLHSQPYDHLVVRRAIKADAGARILADAPRITTSGQFVPDSLVYGAGFADLLSDVLSPRLRRYVERKFDIDLSRYPGLAVVRGYLSKTRDGWPHTDTKHKKMAVHFFLNEAWPHATGRMRVMRSNDAHDYALEMPNEFSMLIFKVCDHSWHGWLPHEGSRLQVELNWWDSDLSAKRAYWRHRVSSFAKTLAVPRTLLRRVPRIQ